MKNSQESVMAQFQADLGSHREKASILQSSFTERSHDALKAFQRYQAGKLFELALAANELVEFADSWKEAITNDSPPLLLSDSWFLKDLVQHLTPGKDEEICYVTGPQYGHVGTLARVCPLQLAEHSPVYARSQANSSADVLIEVNEHGNRLLAMAHSHPGRGPNATCPSSIDTGYLGRIQNAGSSAIGIIVTRDGFVRFFTVDKPFSVHLIGNGVQQVEDHVYQIEIG